MIRLKSKREIAIMEKAAAILRQAFERLQPAVREGVTTLELDRIAEEAIRKAGGTPAFKGYRGFPAALCASVNEEVVHGIPSRRRLERGDLVSLDLGAKFEGYYADAARSYAAGKGSVETMKLIRVAEEAFRAGLQAAGEPGKRIGDISHAVQEVVEKNGFSVVREFCGHGIGRKFHEDPQVLHYGKAGSGVELLAGMIFTIEPMINAGKAAISELPDGWTIITKDRSLSAQWEHTLVVTETGYEVLTLSAGAPPIPDFVKTSLAENP
jgi:methionyl aminopeptidase